MRDHRKLEGDGFTRETFTLPLEQARKKARDILNEYAVGGYATVVENWRQLPDGQIEFTMRRLAFVGWAKQLARSFRMRGR